jgi:hypothetical protein
MYYYSEHPNKLKDVFVMAPQNIFKTAHEHLQKI